MWYNPWYPPPPMYGGATPQQQPYGWREWEEYKDHVEKSLKERDKEAKDKAKKKPEAPKVSIGTAFLMVSTFGPIVTYGYLHLMRLLSTTLVETLQTLPK